MTRLFFLTVAVAALSSCGNAPDPAPAPKDELLGRWEARSVTDTQYNSTGQVVQTVTSTYASGSTTEFTATDCIYATGGIVDSRINYTRDGNVLHIGTSTAPNSYRTIAELSANPLVLVTPQSGPTPAAPYPPTVTMTYAR